MPHIPGHGHSPGQRFYNQPGQGQAGMQTGETSNVTSDAWGSGSLGYTAPGADLWTAQQATNQAIWDQLAMGGFTGGVNTNPGSLDYSNPGQIPTGQWGGGNYPDPSFGWQGNPWGSGIWDPDAGVHLGENRLSGYLDWLVNTFGGEYGDYYNPGGIDSANPSFNNPYVGYDDAQGPGNPWSTYPANANWWFHQALQSDPGWANQFMTGIDDQGNAIWDEQGIYDAWHGAQGDYVGGQFVPNSDTYNPVVGGYTHLDQAFEDFGSFNFQGGIDPNLGGASWGSFTPQGPGGTPPPTPGGAPSPSPTPNPFQNPYKRNQNNPLGNV
tara:strand:+ start:1420 stop:2394 length:975 start_codon:yes stop_codon:yes gene_type:complete